MKKAIKVFLYFVGVEAILRLGLTFSKDYRYFKPRYSAYQESLGQMEKLTAEKLNVLILGGSAISDELPAKVGEQI